eukprot:TRINITY_DN1117_c0_g1_i1.p1 TRINITY_DN1117_c0_g1~~TRINITY_DN1117_c0_g1_i1.p1  ORF type:complete len:1632 (-),score=208.32 TRINITY_DN1117_c0_g1_i1:41-4936(-)
MSTEQCNTNITTNNGNHNVRSNGVGPADAHTSSSISLQLWGSDVPDEVMIGILQLLSPPDLNACRRVCKKWHRIADDRLLWQTKFTHEFGDPLHTILLSATATATPTATASHHNSTRSDSGDTSTGDVSSHRASECVKPEISRELFWKEWNLRGRWRDGRYSLLHGAGHSSPIAYLTVTTIRDRKYVVAIERKTHELRVWDPRTMLAQSGQPIVTKLLSQLVGCLEIHKEVVNGDEIAVVCDNTVFIMPLLSDAPSQVFQEVLDPRGNTKNYQAKIQFNRYFVVCWSSATEQSIDIIPRDTRHPKIHIGYGHTVYTSPLISLLEVEAEQQGTHLEINTYMAVLFPGQWILVIYCVTYSPVAGIDYKKVTEMSTSQLESASSMMITREHVIISCPNMLMVCDIHARAARFAQIPHSALRCSWADSSKIISVSRTGLIEYYALVPSSKPVCVFASSCYDLGSAWNSWSSFYVDSMCVVFGDDSGNILYSEFGADVSEQRQAWPSSCSSRQNMLNGIVHVNQQTMELRDRVYHLYAKEYGEKDYYPQVADQLQAGLKEIRLTLQEIHTSGQKWYPAAIISQLQATLDHELGIDNLIILCDQFVDSGTGGINAARLADICGNLRSVELHCHPEQVYTPLKNSALKVATALSRIYKRLRSVVLDLEYRQIALLPAIDALYVHIHRQRETAVIESIHLSADIGTAREAYTLLKDIVNTCKAVEDIPAGQLAHVFGMQLTDTVFEEIQPLEKLHSSMHLLCVRLEHDFVRLRLIQHAITEQTSISDVEAALIWFRDYADPTSDSYSRLNADLRGEVLNRVSDYHKFIYQAAKLATADVSLWHRDAADIRMHEWRAEIERVLSALQKLHTISATLEVSASERKLSKMAQLLDMLLKSEVHRRGKLDMNIYELADMWHMLKSMHEDVDLSSLDQLRYVTAQAIESLAPEINNLDKPAKALLCLLEEINDYVSRDFYGCLGEFVHMGEAFLERLSQQDQISYGERGNQIICKWVKEGISLGTNALNRRLLISMDSIMDDSGSTCLMEADVQEEAIAAIMSQRDKSWVIAAAAQRMSRFETLKDELVIAKVTTILSRYNHPDSAIISSVLAREAALWETLKPAERSQREQILLDAKAKLKSVSTAGYRCLPQASALYDRISTLIDAERQIDHLFRVRKDLLHNDCTLAWPSSYNLTSTPRANEISDNLELKPTAQVPQLLHETDSVRLICYNLRKSALEISSVDAAYTELLRQIIPLLDCNLARYSEQLTKWIEAILDYIELLYENVDGDTPLFKYQIFTEQVLEAISVFTQIDMSRVQGRLQRINKAIQEALISWPNRILTQRVHNLLESAHAMSIYELEQHIKWLDMMEFHIYNNAAQKLHDQSRQIATFALNSRSRRSVLADLRSVQNLDTQGIAINYVSAQCLLHLCSHHLHALPGYPGYTPYRSEAADAELLDLYVAYVSTEETVSKNNQALGSNPQCVGNMELQRAARDQVDHLVKTVLSNNINNNSSTSDTMERHSNNLAQPMSRRAIREHLDMLSGLIIGLGSGTDLTAEIVSVQKQLYEVLMQTPDANDDMYPDLLDHATPQQRYFVSLDLRATTPTPADVDYNHMLSDDDDYTIDSYSDVDSNAEDTDADSD